MAVTARLKSRIIDILLLVALPVFLCVVGLGVAYFAFMRYDIPWRRLALPNPPRRPASILHVELNSTRDDPTGDVIYIKTDNGAVYAHRVPTDPWRWVDPATTWDTDHTSDCAPDWPSEYSGSDIWEPPPVQKKVVDSAGIRFEHSLAIDVRCYVLFEDGSLEVWAREDNFAMGLMPFIACAPVLAACGAALGLMIGGLVFYIRKKKRKAAQVQPAVQP